MRRCASGPRDDPAAPAELLAAAAFISVLTNEPAEVGAELASRALLAGDSRIAGSAGRPWFSFAAWFSQTTFSLLWAERYAQLRPLLDASIAQARATGDSSRLAVGLARPRLARAPTRRSVRRRRRREDGTCRDELPAPPIYRVLNAGVLVKTLVEQGELEAAEQALAPLHSEAEIGSHRRCNASPRPRPAAGRTAPGRRRAG